MFAGNWRAARLRQALLPVEGVSWRVALIDSCGGWPGALGAAAFISDGDGVCRRNRGGPSGHGSRLAQLIVGRAASAADAGRTIAGASFLNAQPATGAAVAAANSTAVSRRRPHSYESRLEADRAVLAEAVGRAVDQDCIS